MIIHNLSLTLYFFSIVTREYSIELIISTNSTDRTQFRQIFNTLAFCILHFYYRYKIKFSLNELLEIFFIFLSSWVIRKLFKLTDIHRYTWILAYTYEYVESALKIIMLGCLLLTRWGRVVRYERFRCAGKLNLPDLLFLRLYWLRHLLVLDKLKFIKNCN